MAARKKHAAPVALGRLGGLKGGKARANDYFDRGVEAEDCDWRACVDVIAWQRACSGMDAVKFTEAVKIAAK